MTLDEIRINIDRVDKQLRDLFVERMGLAEQVARVKADHDDVIYKPDREAAIIARLTDDFPEAIKKEYTALIKRIMEVSRKYQYGRTIDLRGIDVLSDILTDDSGIEGEARTFAADATMCGFYRMLADEHKYVYASELTMEDGKAYKTIKYASKLCVKENHNRVKTLFVCTNRSGALASILSMIADYGVNLTEITCAPDGKEDWNYQFFIEFAGNLLDKEIQALVYQLGNETEFFRLIGSYEEK